MVELEVVLLLVENDEIVFSETVVTEVMVDELLTLMILPMVVNEVNDDVVCSEIEVTHEILEIHMQIITQHNHEKTDEIACIEQDENDESHEQADIE